MAGIVLPAVAPVGQLAPAPGQALPQVKVPVPAYPALITPVAVAVPAQVWVAVVFAVRAVAPVVVWVERPAVLPVLARVYI